MDRCRQLPLVVLLLLLVVTLLLWLLLPSYWTVAMITGIVASGLFALLRRWSSDLKKADVIDDEVATTDDVADMPKIPGFAIASPGQNPAPAGGSTDSLEGTRFKQALHGVRSLIGGSKVAAASEAAKGPSRTPLRFNAIAESVVGAIDPDVTVSLRTLAGITLPSRLAPFVVEEFREPFAYPVFDMPMYRPLIDISPELFLPNLNLHIAGNQIHSSKPYGWAHYEFARELSLVPHDQRGSYFRQFGTLVLIRS
jgi:hypothetical protein